MSKQRYYVSVSANTIDPEPHDTSSDRLTVMADEKEVAELKRLFEKERHATERTHRRAFIPYKSADHDPATADYNDSMIDLYQYLYRIGSLETRRHIESMNLLQELKNPDYNDPGYDR